MKRSIYFMKSHENKVKYESEVYFYTANTQTKKIFLYPVCVGHFYYEPSYHLKRASLDSFFIAYIENGTFNYKIDDTIYKAGAGQIVMLDCYKYHEFFTSTGCETLWLHFDGILARDYFNLITKNFGPVITLKDNYLVYKYLKKIFNIFDKNLIVKEAQLSNYINNILTELMLAHSNDENLNGHPDIIDEIISYINEHINEDLSLEKLSSLASLSQYHFTRVFKKETGLPPHKYVITARINAAKFYLKTSSLSIKEIALSLGFTSESIFCTTFKNYENITPSKFRTSYTKKSQTQDIKL